MKFSKKTGNECPVCKVDGAFLMAKITTLQEKLVEEKNKRTELFSQQQSVISRKNDFIRKLKSVALKRISDLRLDAEMLAAELEQALTKIAYSQTAPATQEKPVLSKALKAHYELIKKMDNNKKIQKEAKK